MKTAISRAFGAVAIVAAALVVSPAPASAKIEGITGPNFHLSAKPGFISTPDGGSIYMWGYADQNGGGVMQYPGPTLIVNVGDTVTVTLDNYLDTPTSAVFPGLAPVAIGGVPGILTNEAPAVAAGTAGTVTYTFPASRPGTFTYYSGTRPDLQVEMGLVGALIVRPAAGAGQAYDDPSTKFDREYLFLLTEIDPAIHNSVLWGFASLVDTSQWWPLWWMINGRSAPDTMHEAHVPWLPNQPYNCMPLLHPQDKILLRFIGGNREPHPFHVHGQHARIVAHDARPLASVAGGTIDLAQLTFTRTVAPGETEDAIYSWSGQGLGWDIYGHKSSDPIRPEELAADHGKPFPVDLPPELDQNVGEFWSGSPFLGAMIGMAPGLGVQNEMGDYTFMWHSHDEKEMTNNNVFPGGMMTMLMVQHPDKMIME